MPDTQIIHSAYEDALIAELKKAEGKLEHQRNLGRARSAKYYTKHHKLIKPEDRKKPGRKPKPQDSN
jgi:hypothetical protein